MIIEDEKGLSNTIDLYFKFENITCEIASDYYSAIEKVNPNDYSCIILYILLSGGSGLDILKELRKAHNTMSVLIVSAKNALDDNVNGLNIGTDDYPKCVFMYTNH